MFRNKNWVYLNGALFSLFSIINRGFGFLLLLILAKFFTPSEYGYLGLFTTVVSLVGFFLGFCNSSFSVYYFREGEDGLKKSLSAITVVSSFIAIVFLIIAQLFDKLSDYINLEKDILIQAIIVSWLMVFTDVVLDYMRIKKQISYYGYLSCGNAFLNLIITILFVSALLLGWKGRIYAQLLCSLLLALIAIAIFVRNNCFKRIRLVDLKEIVLWGAPLIPNRLSNWFRQGADRLIINAFYTVSEVGIFSFALNLSNIVTMVGIGFNQASSVTLFEILSKPDCKCGGVLTELKKTEWNIVRIYALSTVAVLVFCSIVVNIALPNYTTALPYFYILIIDAFGACVNMLFTNYLYYFKKTRQIMYSNVASSCIHLALSFCLTRYSLYCTCVIYCVSQFILMFWVYRISQRVKMEELQLNKH